jgi:chromosome segregation ATPase
MSEDIGISLHAAAQTIAELRADLATKTRALEESRDAWARENAAAVQNAELHVQAARALAEREAECERWKRAAAEYYNDRDSLRAQLAERDREIGQMQRQLEAERDEHARVVKAVQKTAAQWEIQAQDFRDRLTQTEDRLSECEPVVEAVRRYQKEHEFSMDGRRDLMTVTLPAKREPSSGALQEHDWRLEPDERKP